MRISGYLIVILMSLLITATSTFAGSRNDFIPSRSMPMTMSRYAGPGTTGGGDRKAIDHGTAWFLGKDHPIRTCIELDPGFGADSASVSSALTQAFSTWKNYIETKEIFSDLANRGQAFDWTRLIPSTQVQLLEKCDGSEDLRFYFGSENEEIESAKAEFDYPISFAHRSSYDLKTGWGKGFVWVAKSAEVDNQSPPIWSNPDALEGILLHEIGHVLGCDHVPGTIMDENIADEVMAVRNYPKRLHYVLTSIDDHKELFHCQLCDRRYEGVMSSTGYEDRTAFKILMGREPQGKIHASFHRIAAPWNGYRHGLQGYSWTLSDDRGSHKFYFQLVGQAVVFDGPSVLFQAAIVDSTGGYINNVPASSGEVIQGMTETVSGKKLSVTIIYNDSNTAGSSPIHVTFISDGRQYPGFYQTLGGSCYGSDWNSQSCSTW